MIFNPSMRIPEPINNKNLRIPTENSDFKKENQPTTTRNGNFNYNSGLPSNNVDNSSLSDPNLFLKMLTSSMVNQDPMNPTDSNEFLNQITQYAIIETLTKTNQNINMMTELQMASNMYTVLNSATDLVGKDVTVTIPSETEGEKDLTKTGKVEEVKIEDDGIFIVIDGEKYEYVNVTSIK